MDIWRYEPETPGHCRCEDRAHRADNCRPMTYLSLIRTALIVTGSLLLPCLGLRAIDTPSQASEPPPTKESAHTLNTWARVHDKAGQNGNPQCRRGMRLPIPFGHDRCYPRGKMPSTARLLPASRRRVPPQGLRL